MTMAEPREIVLPALRGVMGDWVYYSCLMSLYELSERVNYAKEIHKSAGLSDMIQRQLEDERGRQIAQYLKMQPQRFFNSLVVATYGGQPNWHSVSAIRSDDLQDLDQETIESVGFLTLSGDEKLFALDGQHRLAGIRTALTNGSEQVRYDEVSVILVAHLETSEGLERTRRLFTTLNKTAKPVSKGDIIALDEDDVMSISVRRLIEETELFSGQRIAFVASNNMPSANRESLTTIGNLYDILTILFTNAQSHLKKRKIDLQNVRPSDQDLDAYFNYATEFFLLLRGTFGELSEFFDAETPSGVVTKYRGPHGGKATFRPLGLEIITQIIARLTLRMPLHLAVNLASKLPRDLDSAPYLGLMWDPSSQVILNPHKVTLREVLCYMVSETSANYPEAVLVERYRVALGDEHAQLPSRLV